MPNVDSPPVSGTALSENRIRFVRENFSSKFKFRLLMLKLLPMGYLSGMRIESLTEDACTVSLKYKWLIKNPFKSTFWAVMGMAAEMASGALLMEFTSGQKPSLATILVEQSGKFYKKAVGKQTYVCQSGKEMRATVERAYQSGEGEVITCPVQAFDSDGELIADFTFVWSMKLRSK